MITTRQGTGSEFDLGAFAQLSETLGRSFDVESVTYNAAGVTVTVRDDVTPGTLEAAVKTALKCVRFRADDVLFEHAVPDAVGLDPQPALEARGDITMVAPGIFAFKGAFLRVRQALETLILPIAARLNATELSYPALWPVPMLTAINYFHDFPKLAFLAAGSAPEHDASAVFASRLSREGGKQSLLCTAENGLAPAASALAPTVCDCCYWLLRGKRDVPSQVFTVHGQVYRNEVDPDDRIDRLSAFTMREIIAVGTPEFVLAKRETLINEAAELMRALDLPVTIKAASDPFFCNDALYKSAYQHLYKLKYEIEASLYGGRSAAIASINLHNDYFSRAYGFTGTGGAEIFSACIGFGYERMTYALFCRYGAEFSAWPAALRARLGL